MDKQSAESDLRAVEMIAQTSQASGGSIGAKETDVSTGHAVCSRDDQGPTQPPSAKSPPKTEREFERAMRELGYSKRQAREIVTAGFKGLAEAEPAEDASELSALMERMKQLFNERPL